MAINNKLSSYLAMANFLKEKGYTDDEINKVNNGIVGENGQGTIDANYFSNYTKLSEDDKVLGKSFLQNYINDVQADETYKNQVNLANNQARQDTAYNDYVNRRLASYLGEIEAANGQTGYTGLTEGNRIAMANNQINAQNTISNTQQSALQKALSDYNNQLITNANTADDTYTKAKSNLDEKADTEYNNAITELEKYLNTDGVKGAYSDGTNYISQDSYDYLKGLIDNNTQNESVRNKLRNYVDAYYGWASKDNIYKQETENNIITENANATKTQTDTAGITSFETADNSHKSVNEATNNASRQYSFKIDDENYLIKASSDEKTNKTQNIAGFSYLSTENQNTIKNMKVGDFVAYESKYSGKVIVYRANNQYVVFVKNNSYNTTKDNKAGFDKLYEKAKKI